MSNPAAQSLSSFNNNGKELQETGFYDYGWRQYMPDLGRWNGIDQLAEMYLSTSTYAYVAGNPVSYADVDGRWFNSDGSIDTSGYTPRFTSSRQMRNSFLGISPNDGGGGGYSFTGNAAGSMYNYFANGGTIDGLSFNKGFAMWSTMDDAKNSMYYDGDNMLTGNSGGVTFHRAKFGSDMNNWYDTGGKANWFVSAAGSGVSSFANRFYIGTARPNAPISFFGRNYYGNGRTFIKAAPVARSIGKFSFGLDVVMDLKGMQIYEIDKTSPNAVHPSKALLNTVMGLIGTEGGTYGAIISALYFGVDAFYPGGWIGASETAAETEAYEQRMTGHPFFSNSALKF
ncbi:RHS repeat-associated core domain-containing protein [Chryseobacterium sp. MYb264]|uniref:RHS repeat-associated core domain-containing protein n=1 Tax=Chryseobacterium sp. MYb264 TaxID=2745153 RepID=UPI002E101108|nr:RHS repeat-associated core domain-containing protein [Chryseobacterium sp. MYb264]